MDKLTYNAVRPWLQMGSIIEWQGPTHDLLAQGIMARTKTGRSHTSVVVRFDVSALGDRVFIAEAIESGIELRVLSRRIEEYDGRVFAVFPRELPHQADRDCMLGYAMAKLGTPYDYWGTFFRNLIGRAKLSDDKLFCSEFAQFVLNRGGLIPAIPHALRPGEMRAHYTVPTVEVEIVK